MTLHVSEISVESISEKRTRYNGRFTRLGQSVFALLIFSLLFFYILVHRFYPWRDIANQDIPAWVIEFAGRCADFCNEGRRTDVVVLGTSLIAAINHRLYTSPYSLYKAEHVPSFAKAPCDNLHMHLANALNIPKEKISISMPAVPAAMMTDQLLILQKLIEKNKKPKLLVLTVAARDLIDNNCPSPRNSPVARIFLFHSKNKNFLPRSFRFEDLASCWDGHTMFTELVRTDCLRKTRSAICELTGHPENLWIATNVDFRKNLEIQNLQKQKNTAPPAIGSTFADRPEFGRKNTANAFSADIKDYSNRYLPFNRKLMENQFEAYLEILKSAEKANIRVVVIWIPVSKPNTDLLNVELLKEVKSRCFAAANKNNANAYDLETEVKKLHGASMVIDDYYDSVHVNKAGAEKLIGPISNLMAQEVKALAKAH